MINPKELHNIAEKSYKTNEYIILDLLKYAEHGINHINAEILRVANDGEFEIEISLNKLYAFILDYNDITGYNFSFSRHNFNMFIAHIRNELNKHHYKFVEKQYQYDAYPDPILLIRW